MQPAIGLSPSFLSFHVCAGTFWRVGDEDGRRFASVFHKEQRWLGGKEGHSGRDDAAVCRLSKASTNITLQPLAKKRPSKSVHRFVIMIIFSQAPPPLSIQPCWQARCSPCGFSRRGFYRGWPTQGVQGWVLQAGCRHQRLSPGKRPLETHSSGGKVPPIHPSASS